MALVRMISTATYIKRRVIHHIKIPARTINLQYQFQDQDLRKKLGLTTKIGLIYATFFFMTCKNKLVEQYCYAKNQKVSELKTKTK